VSDERRDYAILISLAGREEAEVVAAALRADGIDAFIGNSNHAYVEWLLVPALNGLQIFVPRPRLAEAKDRLRERIKENAEHKDGELVRRNDQWKMWLGILVMLSPWLLSGVLFGSRDLGAWLFSASLP
jgi:hypothetical protein